MFAGVIHRSLIAITAMKTRIAPSCFYFKISFSGNGDLGRSTALIPLGCHDLIVKSSQLHTQLAPRIEMISSCDRASDSLSTSDTKVLLKGSSSNNRRSIGTCVFVDVVDSSVRSHSPFGGQARRGIVRAVRFDNVVLDQRRFGPAVDREVAVTAGRERSGVFDHPVELLRERAGC